MMVFSPWGFKPCPFIMIPALPCPGTEVRVRAGPFTWELGPWPSSGEARPYGYGPAPIFQPWKSLQDQATM